jgi:hypothetical protein
LEEVQRGALGRQHRRERALDASEGLARADLVPVVRLPPHLERLVDLAEHLGGGGAAREDALLARDDRARHAMVLRDERRGEIAQRADVLRQRPGHRVTHRLARRMNAAHAFLAALPRFLSYVAVVTTAEYDKKPR